MALGLVIATICLGVVIAILAVDIMGIFSSKNHFEVDGRVCIALSNRRLFSEPG